MPARIRAALPEGGTLPPAQWGVRHAWMVRILWVHVVVLLAWGAAQERRPLAVVAAVLPLMACGAVAWTGAPRRARETAVVLGLLSSSAVVVHLAHGYTEAHFHFFVVVALLSLYEAWPPYLLAFAYVLVHHGVLGVLDPAGVFREHAAQPSPWRWAAVHALSIGALGVVHLSAWRLNERTRRGWRTSEDRLAWRASHDPVTGLANRWRLSEALAEHRGAAALLLIDVDDFRVVNDSLGFRTGDMVLAAIADRLGAATGPDDLLARVGGDTYALVAAGVDTPAAARALAGRLQDSLREPVASADAVVHVTASIGVRLPDPADGDPGAVLRDADAALNAASASGRSGVVLFDAGMGRAVAERLMIERGLRQAVAGDQLRIVHQPVVQLSDGRVTGVEALVRWRHPELGDVPPDRFIPVAEQNGTIIDIGAWVLGEACRDLASWRRPDLSVAVNVSACQLVRPEFVDTVARTLVETGLRPERLCLEVTETAVLSDPASTAATLAGLAALGVRIAVDDFGVGTGSLHQLRALLPVDVIKIDRSFVTRLVTDPQDAAIVQGVVGLAHCLGVTVVAEGVETGDQVELLRLWGCETAQGHLFSRPLPAADAIAWVRERDAPSAGRRDATPRTAAPARGDRVKS